MDQCYTFTHCDFDAFVSFPRVGTYTTLLSPPHTIVRNGVAAILSFLEAQRTQKTTEFRCTSIVSTPSIVESRRNVAQRAPISEEKYQADLERREVLLLRVQKRRLELDRIILQRQIASLLVERNAMAERLLAMEEGPKTCCVVRQPCDQKLSRKRLITKSTGLHGSSTQPALPAM